MIGLFRVLRQYGIMAYLNTASPDSQGRTTMPILKAPKPAPEIARQ
jgi:hypothetical protein